MTVNVSAEWTGYVIIAVTDLVFFVALAGLEEYHTRRRERSNDLLIAEWRRVHFPAIRDRVDLNDGEMFI